jgi:hypothetical protein
MRFLDILISEFRRLGPAMRLNDRFGLSQLIIKHTFVWCRQRNTTLWSVMQWDSSTVIGGSNTSHPM